jgi:hypothetical protein
MRTAVIFVSFICTYLVCACIGLFVVALVAPLIVDPYRFTSLRPFENAIATTFNGKADIGLRSSSGVVCAGFECEEVLPRLPPVSSVRCTQHMRSANLPKYDIHITAPGACCLAQFGELGRTEVHIYRQAERYTILLTEPQMREVVKALDCSEQSRG